MKKRVKQVAVVLFCFLICTFSFPFSAFADTYINVAPFYDIVMNLINSKHPNKAIMYRSKSSDDYFLFVNSQAGYGESLLFWGSGNNGLYCSTFGSYYIYQYNKVDGVWESVRSSNNSMSDVLIGNMPKDDWDICWTLADYDIYDSTQASVISSFSASDSFYNAQTGEPISDKLPDDSEISGSGGSGYDDSNLLNQIREHFNKLFNIILYGNVEGEEQDNTELEENKTWLESVNDTLTDFIVYLNDAPDFIRNGFTAVTNAQEGINYVVENLNSYFKPLYFGIVGILVIFIIRKIIGR